MTWGEFVAARLLSEFGDRGIDVFASFMRAACYGTAGFVTRIVLEGAVVVDPEYASGRPTMAGRRLRADIIAEAVNAGERRGEVARMWDLTPTAVDDAVRFVSRA